MSRTLLLAVIAFAAAPEPAYRPKLPEGRFLTQREVEILVRGRTFFDMGGRPHTYTRKGEYLYSTDMVPMAGAKYQIKNAKICTDFIREIICQRIFKGGNGEIYFVKNDKSDFPRKMRIGLVLHD